MINDQFELSLNKYKLQNLEKMNRKSECRQGHINVNKEMMWISQERAPSSINIFPFTVLLLAPYKSTILLNDFLFISCKFLSWKCLSLQKMSVCFWKEFRIYVNINNLNVRMVVGRNLGIQKEKKMAFKNLLIFQWIESALRINSTKKRLYLRTTKQDMSIRSSCVLLLSFDSQKNNFEKADTPHSSRKS